MAQKYLHHAPYQHGFRPEHLTTSALLQQTSQCDSTRGSLDRMVCVAVDLLPAFTRLSIYCLHLIQLAITTCYQQITAYSGHTPWLSCYLRGRQAHPCFRGVKLTFRQVNIGVLQTVTLAVQLLHCRDPQNQSSGLLR